MDLYAQDSCRRICQATLQKLPREIRDRIYFYIHGEQVSYIAPGSGGKGSPRFVRDVGDLVQSSVSMRYFFDYSPYLAYCRSRDLTLAHYLDRRYVGRAMQKEIVQSWFRTGVFQIGDTRVVRRFLSHDWKLFGIRPVERMRRIELFAYSPSDALDDFDRTRPIDTNTLLEEFKAVDPEEITHITVVSRVEPEKFRPDGIKVIETPNFQRMMRQIYEAKVRGHQVLTVNLKTHGETQFDLPDAQAIEWEDWYKCALSNLQRAGTERLKACRKSSKRLDSTLH